MLEGLAAWVLNNYLGQYLENLNTDQLSIGLLQGQVELENLPLRKDALDHLDLPVEIRAGFVGRIKLKIPVRRLRSEPWVISIEKLYVVTGPIRASPYDAEREEQLMQERKLSQLDSLEARWRADRDTKQEASYYASSYSSWMSYGTSLVANIVENVQLKVKDVHFRYEDDQTNPSQSFAWGFTIQSLSAQSTNDFWVPQFVCREGVDLTRKLIELQNLAVYWDTDATLVGDLPMAELAVAMQQHTQPATVPTDVETEGVVTPHVHEYIVEPVSAQARLQQNTCPRPLRSRTTPRFVCDLQLDSFPIVLHETQYKQFVTLMRDFEQLDGSRKFQRWRPTVGISGHALEWWQYAVHCHLTEIRERQQGRNWTSALRRATDIVRYVEVYTSHLINPVMLPIAAKKHKDAIELELPLAEVKALREVAMERVLRMEEEKARKQVQEETRRSSGQGLLHRWFPLWGGWYSSDSGSDQGSRSSLKDGGKFEIKDEETAQIVESLELEEEILDVLKDTVENNTLLRRDVVFAQLNFVLKRGTFSLMSTSSIKPEGSTVMELEFADVQVSFESRPRSASAMFRIRLGAMFLRDKVTSNCVFPHLVAPHSRDSTYPSKSTYLKLATLTGLANVGNAKTSEEPLFELLYERKPFNSTADYRLHVCSKSLDMVYNAPAFRCIMEFFIRPHQRVGAVPSRHSEVNLTSAAKIRYEQLKRQTKRELQKNWDQIMEGDQGAIGRWDMYLDISAPHIIIPENLTDPNTTLVIFDFGRLQFCNSSCKILAKPDLDMGDSDEEDFRTPCSSPPDLEELTTARPFFPPLLTTVPEEGISPNLTESLLHQRMYDKYTLQLCNLQVLVARMKDNWHFAHLRGTSHMHVLDRFNISIQLERRTLYTTDPQWPSATLAGNLPKLVVHVNEQKVLALRRCVTVVSGFPLPFSPSGATMTPPSSYGESMADTSSASSTPVMDSSQMSSAMEDENREIMEESRLLLVQFCVDQLSLEVQSRGRSVAELQVTGVKVLFTKRPFDSSLGLTVHSLLLVDAMQTLGPDFELLVASHKHVSMDSVSGSIRDSDPNSPTSPSSPISPRPVFTSPVILSAALSSLQTSQGQKSFNRASPPLMSASPNSPLLSSGLPVALDVQSAEALISVDLVIISPNCPSSENSNETLRIVSVHFNNLDIIANQETLTELLGFFKLIIPNREKVDLLPPPDIPPSPFEDDREAMLTGLTTRTELTFDFHHLSVLLLRVLHKDGGTSLAKKVATATMSGARIWATLGSGLKVQGSLDGLQVLDLTPEGSVHQRIVSVGHDPITERQSEFVYHDTSFGSGETDTGRKAFSFIVVQPEVKTTCLEVNLRMASVCYTHSSHFINEFEMCMTEFRTYMANLAASIRTAAAEVALDIVNRGTDALSTSFYGGIHEASPGRSRSISGRSSQAKQVDTLFSGDTQVRLDVVLETPIVVLPRTAVGSDILVAHLGRITVHNAHNVSGTSGSNNSISGCAPDTLTGTILERITVGIRDVSLYSMMVTSVRQGTEAPVSSGTSFPASCIHRLYSGVSEAQPILHDTVIELVVDRLVGQTAVKMATSQTVFFVGEEPLGGSLSSPSENRHSLQVVGRIVTPLKISLSRPQYEQVLETLNNLTYYNRDGDDNNGSGASEPLPSEMEDLHPSVSALKLDEIHLPRPDSFSSSVESPKKAFVTLQGHFEVPILSVELRGDLADEEQGLVNLSFRDFQVDMSKKTPYSSSFEVSLQALVMEDLLQEPTSKHRHLMASVVPEVKGVTSSSAFKSQFLSTSCPDMLYHEPQMPTHQSLPDKLQMESAFASGCRSRGLGQTLHRQTTLPGKDKDSYPCTPPPSPSADYTSRDNLRSDTLVHMHILLVDRKAPDFVTKYNSVNRQIDIDFNCLETIINLQSWVMVLDFFNATASSSPSRVSIPSTFSLSRANSSSDLIRGVYGPYAKEVVNSEIDLQVRSLTLVLNKPDYELARANISHVTSRMSIKEGHFSVHGKLGSMSVHDLTPSGHLYPERFSTSGEEALDFYFFRFGTPDPDLRRQYDMYVKLKMASVRYIHTQRFQAETLAFFQHFNQLQDVMSRFRAAAAGAKVNERAGRRSRVLLDVHADAPVILVPESASATNILVADLGKLTVTNSFLFAGTAGTVSKVHGVSCRKILPLSSASARAPASPSLPKVNQEEDCSGAVSPDSGHLCLLDVMHIGLVDMDLYSASRLERKQAREMPAATDLDFTAFIVRRQEEPLFKQKCRLKLQVERNLDTDLSHSVPDLSVKGLLSTVHCSLDVNQYKLIRGLLDFNLGEPLEQFEPNVPTHPLQNTNIQTVLTGNVWTCMSIDMDLDNVTLELLQHRAHPPDQEEASLAKINFTRSRFIYESYSDSYKDIDLVSQEISISDTRFRDDPANARPNVFTNILQETSKAIRRGVLQAEFHYRATKELTRFTILLNNMRLMAIFDWWDATRNFILTQAEQPKSSAGSTACPPAKRQASGLSNIPLTVSAGIVTRRAPLLDKPEVPLEVKINITDTELVVVEDASVWDTNAVILKSTAVISYRPNVAEKPLSCSLQSLEVFSCVLGLEEDTALSIVDPVTVNIEVNGKTRPSSTGGLLDATTVDIVHTLEISTHNLNVRLSYHDVDMFLRIVDSIPRQAQGAAARHNSGSWPVNLPVHITRLEDLGFARNDCIKAYDQCQGNLDNAAMWLTKNAPPVSPVLSTPRTQLTDSSSDENMKGTIALGALEVRIACICLCLIDDCKDADVPLVEMTLSGLYLQQTLDTGIEGSASVVLSGDYYNRSLSGWEPVLEPWRTQITWVWASSLNGLGKKLHLKLDAKDVLNINVTSALIDLYTNVKVNWTEDYYRRRGRFSRNQAVVGNTPDSSSTFPRRSPFVPFALKNDTGCSLWFTTITTTPNRLAQMESDVTAAKESSFVWTQVAPEEVVPFTFEGRGKLRHRDSHELKIHQLLVRVDGWQPVAPVSVDKVGVFFRHANPQVSRTATIYSEIPPARVVFAVTLEGSARKLVTVRSALVLCNRLEEAVEVKLENAAVHLGDPLVVQVAAGMSWPVPMWYGWARWWVQPLGGEWQPCTQALHWYHVVQPSERSHEHRICKGRSSADVDYRFCVCIQRENFPPDRQTVPFSIPRSRIANVLSGHQILVQPGHTLYLLAPLTVSNLLPYELHYEIVNTTTSGSIRSGQVASLHTVDVHKSIEMRFTIESFNESDTVTIQPGNANYNLNVQMYDSSRRLLVLRIKVTLYKGALKLQVFAPYWLVNRSGLPLIFRQDGTQQDAAGQFDEHEMARSVAPLLFSFADKESPFMCLMRVGSSVHRDGHSNWCHRFHLEKGVRVRRLRVSSLDPRPDWVYNIGIDVRTGRGRYRGTHVVTLSPRFQLDNRTSHRLQFAQKYATVSAQPACPLSSMPSCTLPFHWPRLDLDQLLCVRRADLTGCHWSGGFPIENIDSFHINMRDQQGRSHFLRVEIALQGATYFVVFTDSDKMPSPFRIDNFSEVPITYFQSNVLEERLRTVVRPKSCVSYAWDEPTLPPTITCCAPGGSSAVYNMNVFGEGRQLTYENFIYIAFTATFREEPIPGRGLYGSQDIADRQLVLDVPNGTRVVLSRKETGRRSQLWRMTSTGMLQHEGSSPPRDPRRPHLNSGRVLVLDLAGLASLPEQYVHLMLRKPDERRRSTQTWHFTDDGRLCSDLNNMYVQSAYGCDGLVAGNDVVLGPQQPVTYMTTSRGIPIEQAVGRQRLWPGSGMLSVKVLADGPTRVLQLTDIRQKALVSVTSRHSDWVMVEETKFGKLDSPDDELKQDKQVGVEFHVCLSLKQGLGVSLVNHIPEELLYASFSNILIEYTQTGNGQTLDGSVENIKIDNQLFDAEIPILLFVTPSSKHDSYRHMPAIHFTVHKMPSENISAEIFKHMMVTVKNLTVQVEERILWKLLQFVGCVQSDQELDKLDESDFDGHNRSVMSAAANAKRFYFGTLKLVLHQVRLSMFTTSRLPSDLQAIKHKMGLTLIKFEDAQVELDPFLRVHPFETLNFLIDSILEHYKEELKGQAAKILGAFDFLGNPLGLVNDVSEGLVGFINDGNVGGLLKNVTHGLSNSAAKVTGSLSDGLGKVTMDEKHEEARKKMWKDHRGGSSDHLVAGLKGLGYGILGGMTSIVTQTYAGVATEGIPGFFSGLGKGIVGTVAKPAVGVLDFATGAASAVRDTSRSSAHNVPGATRPPRVCLGPGGLLPRFSLNHSHGQRHLYILNEKDYGELFIAYEQLRSGNDDLRALISSRRVFVLTKGDPSNNNIVLSVDHSALCHCLPLQTEENHTQCHYLELTVKANQRTPSSSATTGQEVIFKRPKVRCDSELIAQRVGQQINYAKSLFEEMKHTLPPQSDDGLDD